MIQQLDQLPVKQLIPIIQHEGEQAVNLRELYAFLEVSTRFNDWAHRMFDYGFTEGVDYAEILLLKNEEQVHGGHNRRDWAVTLDMAKEISMIQRTEKGKQARQYFIEMEKRARSAPQVSLSLDLEDPDAVVAMAGHFHRAAQAYKVERERRQIAEGRINLIEGGNGFSIRQFHKHYFPDVPERKFFELLYKKRLLIDQRGARGRDQKGRLINGKEHLHPAAAGKAYFFLDPHFDKETGKRHYNTRVRPGTPETELVARLVKYGLPVNPHRTNNYPKELF